MAKSLKRKRKQEEGEEFDSEVEEMEEPTGEFRLKEKYGKHQLGKHPLMTIKGKRFKRVAEAGDVIICPPRLLAAFMDKFERIDKLLEEVKKDIILVKQHKGGGRYNVFNAETGNKVNDDFLTKEEADELIASERQEVE